METSSDEMVMGAVWALGEFSLLVSQQNPSDVSLTALDDTKKRFYKEKGPVWEQKMSKSAKAQVDELLARESHQIQEQKICKIRAAMEVQVYGVEKVTTTNWREFQLRLNRARQVSTTWSDTDRQSAQARLEGVIHLVTPVKHKRFDKLFQYPNRQQLQEVVTTASGPRSTFAKKVCSNDNCCRRRDLWSGKHDHRQECGISCLSIRCWDWSGHLEYCWYGPLCESAPERDLWYHFEYADVFQEGIVHPLAQI